MTTADTVLSLPRESGARVVLKPGRQGPVRRGRRWVYRTEIDRIDGDFVPGDTVSVAGDTPLDVMVIVVPVLPPGDGEGDGVGVVGDPPPPPQETVANSTAATMTARLTNHERRSTKRLIRRTSSRC